MEIVGIMGALVVIFFIIAAAMYVRNLFQIYHLIFVNESMTKTLPELLIRTIGIWLFPLGIVMGCISHEFFKKLFD